MVYVLTETVVMNVVLTLAILILGVWTYMKKRSMLSLYIGIGFGIFAISHVLTLLGYGSVAMVILPLRALGYLVVIAGLLVRVTRRGK